MVSMTRDASLLGGRLRLQWPCLIAAPAASGGQTRGSGDDGGQDLGAASSWVGARGVETHGVDSCREGRACGRAIAQRAGAMARGAV
ncbi:hypothetical protein AAW51_2659 [Caldimonas brevitalea]|uniref:Uncharacterized protein n=1 Tax=Caldimonas brevitalea TaxID=413882 RepID=A0A0G3BS59_9BURK|nr:hypothetical protein AAW51_2659 [Caldimonas brevitalea]